MASNRMSIKIEGEAEQVHQFTIPTGDTFGGSVPGMMEEHHFIAGTEDIASLLGNPSTDSLTMYKSEQLEMEDEGGSLLSMRGQPCPKVLPGNNSGVYSPAPHPSSHTHDDQDNEASSSSSSCSDDDDSSASDDGDSDSSGKSEDESKDDGAEESRERQGKAGEKRIMQQFNRKKRFKNDTERRKLERKVQEVKLKKALEFFAQENIEEYLSRRGFRHVSFKTCWNRQQSSIIQLWWTLINCFFF